MAFLEKKCSDLQVENNSLKINQKDLEDLIFLERKRNNELSETLISKESEIVMVSIILAILLIKHSREQKNRFTKNCYVEFSSSSLILCCLDKRRTEHYQI